MNRKLVTVRSTPTIEVRVPAEWLAEMGLAEGAAAAGHVSRGRLVLAAPRGMEEVQSELGELARELEDLRGRMADVAGELPEPTEPMLRSEQPVDVAADVLETLECILTDELDPIIRKLRAAATVTAEQLREHWHRTRSEHP